MLMHSPMTGRVYIVTRYKDRGGGRYEAITKYDVTENFLAVVEASKAPEGAVTMPITGRAESDDSGGLSQRGPREPSLLWGLVAVAIGGVLGAIAAVLVAVMDGRFP